MVWSYFFTPSAHWPEPIPAESYDISNFYDKDYNLRRSISYVGQLGYESQGIWTSSLLWISVSTCYKRQVCYEVRGPHATNFKFYLHICYDYHISFNTNVIFLKQGPFDKNVGFHLGRPWNLYECQVSLPEISTL